jgi:hypothetical protein
VRKGKGALRNERGRRRENRQWTQSKRRVDEDEEDRQKGLEVSESFLLNLPASYEFYRPHSSPPHLPLS